MPGLKRIPCEVNEKFFASLAHNYECDINCVYEFTGRIDIERLTAAFLTALAHEPMLSYRFVSAFWRPWWEPILRSARRDLVKVLTTDGTPAALDQVMRSPVDAAARLFIFRGPVDDTVCFRLDHRLVDATSSRLLVEAVAAHYAAGDAPPAADATLVRRTSKLLHSIFPPKLRRQGLLRLQQQGKASKRAPAAYRVPPITEADPVDLPPLIKYPVGAFDELKARTLRDRGTPTLAILAATYLSLMDTVGIDPASNLHLGMAVDLRRYLPPEHLPAPACLMIGRAQFPVASPKNPTLSGVMEQLRVGVSIERGPLFGLTMSSLVMDLPIPRLVMKLIPFRTLRAHVIQKSHRSNVRPDVQISDLGEFGKPGDQWGESELRHGYCTSGTWGVPGSISICYGTCGSRFTIAVGTGPRSFARKLAEAMHRYLCSYIGWPLDCCDGM